MKTLFMKLIIENGSEVIQKQPLPLITSFLVAVLFFQRRFTLFTSYYPLVVLWWKSRWNCKNLVTPPNRQVLLIFLCIQEKPWFSFWISSANLWTFVIEICSQAISKAPGFPHLGTICSNLFKVVLGPSHLDEEHSEGVWLGKCVHVRQLAEM